MSHLPDFESPLSKDLGDPSEQGTFEVRAIASSFVVACLKNGYHDEAADFIDWYYEAFGDELED